MKKHTIAIAAFALCTLPAVAGATPARPGGYVSGFFGVSAASDADVTSIDNQFGDVFNDRVEYDPNIYVGGTGGYDFGHFRLEGELSYKHAEISSITDDTGFRFRGVDGNLGALAFMANAFVDLHNNTPVTPYFGGGIGFAVLSLSDTYGSDTSGRLLLYPEDDTTVFAYQAGGGVEIAINPSLSLDLGYRYFGTTKGTFDSDWITTTKLKYESHNGMVGFRVKF
ncbi:outer membrane beta-barrel protein [Geobacter sulfurreducens]|jgi:opacity protein-like surface antigen|uniref:Outer membrane channel, putative n=1 Tax=Geobacter sulfurreducens (strain ATCC 51573 / DSM 12127 / PCA) TaxID=243231 RepID=Q74F42_GEOSL|nr:outer membrane beta-barrel protein [Geobacter sulfurreducens]AAR34097.1 outer membrane channel, putative [Geobacter sulfurreducens PCA]UAC04833.1 outer membrane beta-barrel protein [Geobacter sulfurreducens]UTG93459.1 porin family protein [Geobacter sulfurreducens]HCD96897.1 porin family protein [Geobacter sulfurreducens]